MQETEGYELNELELNGIILENAERCDDIIQYLSDILNDRTVPEQQKKLARKEYNRIMDQIGITM